VKSFADVPTIIAGLHDDIDFFEPVLADIRRKELPGAATVKGELPGVAQTPSEDFRAPLRPVGKGVARRDRIGRTLVHVDPQDLAQDRHGILAVALGPAPAHVVRVPAIPNRDVEVSVRPEHKAAAIMVEIGLIDLHQHPLGGRVNAPRIVRCHPEFGQVAGVIPLTRCGQARGGTVMNIQFPVLFKTRVHCQPDQAAFVEALIELDHAGAQIENRPFGCHAFAVQQMHRTRLVGHQDAPRTVLQGHKCRGGGETFREQAEPGCRRLVCAFQGRDQAEQTGDPADMPAPANDKRVDHGPEPNRFDGEAKPLLQPLGKNRTVPQEGRGALQRPAPHTPPGRRQPTNQLSA